MTNIADFDRLGHNNTVIGHGSQVGEYVENSTVVGSNSKIPDHSKNLILIGQDIVIPDGYPRENAIYIGNQTDELFLFDNDWFGTSIYIKQAMQKMAILAKHLQENPDNKRIFYNLPSDTSNEVTSVCDHRAKRDNHNGTFRDLMLEVMTMKEKVDILWDEYQRRNPTITDSS